MMNDKRHSSTNIKCAVSIFFVSLSYFSEKH